MMIKKAEVFIGSNCHFLNVFLQSAMENS